MTTKNYIAKLENTNQFNDEQLQQIRAAVEKNLTNKQIKILANPQFDWQQMRAIADAFASGISIDRVKHFAKPHLPHCDISQVHFAKDFTLEQIKMYTSEKINTTQRFILKIAFIDKINVKEMHNIKVSDVRKFAKKDYVYAYLAKLEAVMRALNS